MWTALSICDTAVVFPGHASTTAHGVPSGPAPDGSRQMASSATGWPRNCRLHRPWPGAAIVRVAQADGGSLMTMCSRPSESVRAARSGSPWPLSSLKTASAPPTGIPERHDVTRASIVKNRSHAAAKHRKTRRTLARAPTACTPGVGCRPRSNRTSILMYGLVPAIAQSRSSQQGNTTVSSESSTRSAAFASTPSRPARSGPRPASASPPRCSRRSQRRRR